MHITVEPCFKANIVSNGVVLPVYCIGKTADEAKANAEKFWQSELAKERTKQGSFLPAADNATGFEPPANRPRNVFAEPGANVGRGAHLIGLVWLVNRTTKEKKRVPPGDVDAMLAQGWERGGPKTKL